ncbi:MAG: hypothetical protein J7K98_00835 [Candidatus Aenigmarchaeota archaeon]|nr:hypothetical protein [Candidatus Aenigmarchaeota archaeon]
MRELSKGQGQIITVIVLVVLAIIFLVFGLSVIRKSQTISEAMASILLQNFEQASDVEKAILCSYFRCRYGCPNAAELGDKLKWKNEKDEWVSCADVCDIQKIPNLNNYYEECKAPDEKGHKDCLCDKSILTPIVVKVDNPSTEGKISRAVLQAYIKKSSDQHGVCILNKNSVYCIFTNPTVGGEQNSIFIPEDYMLPDETQKGECNIGSKYRNSILSTELKEGTYYIFTWASCYGPFCHQQSFDTCILNEDPRNHPNEEPWEICKKYGVGDQPSKGLC